nr:hypothetical protein [Tanacetum cinerariifolium]
SGLEVIGGASIVLSRKILFSYGEGVVLEEKGKEFGLDSKDEFVPRVKDVFLVDGVLEGAFGGEGGDDFAMGEVIMEYLMKISKKAHILELKRRHLKITVLTSYTSYPSRKIWRICACTSQETTKIHNPIRRI